MTLTPFLPNHACFDEFEACNLHIYKTIVLILRLFFVLPYSEYSKFNDKILIINHLEGFKPSKRYCQGRRGFNLADVNIFIIY
jgi:hypothetical protein